MKLIIFYTDSGRFAEDRDNGEEINQDHPQYKEIERELDSNGFKESMMIEFDTETKEVKILKD